MGRLSWRVRRRVAYLCKYRCVLCCSLLPEVFQVDHILPVFMGGSDEESNLQSLCANCHQVKTSQEATRAYQEALASARASIPSARKCAACGLVYSSFWRHRGCQKERRKHETPRGSSRKTDSIVGRGTGGQGVVGIEKGGGWRYWN
jgi:hypothetical protein